MPMKSLKTVTTVTLWLSTAFSSSFELTIHFITPLILDTLVVCNAPWASFGFTASLAYVSPSTSSREEDLLIFQVSAWRLGLQCSLVVQPKVLSPFSTLLSLLLPCCPCDLHSLLLCTVDIHLRVLCSQWPISYLKAESIYVEQFVSTRVCST